MTEVEVFSPDSPKWLGKKLHKTLLDTVNEIEYEDDKAVAIILGTKESEWLEKSQENKVRYGEFSFQTMSDGSVGKLYGVPLYIDPYAERKAVIFKKSTFERMAGDFELVCNY